MLGIYERTPRPSYQIDKNLIHKWEQVLRSHGLSMHTGELDGHSYGGEVNEITEDDLHSPASNTVNRDVHNRDRSRKTVSNLPPPPFVDVRSLLARLDEISKEIVRLRVVDELSWKAISNAIGLCERQVFTRFDAAIAKMRLPECPPFSVTDFCLVCGTEFPLKKKGPPRKFCSTTCQINKYREIHGRSDGKPKILTLDGGTF